MSPVEMFQSVTEKGSYIIGYIVDGWTKEIIVPAKNPSEAMMRTQNLIGGISSVTFVERRY